MKQTGKNKIKMLYNEVKEERQKLRNDNNNKKKRI